MQPTYLPWIGFFDLIDLVDVFVFLDDVQFTKRSWQQRNRIRTAKGLEWLTVPVKVKGAYTQRIMEARIEEPTNFQRKHIGAVRFNYERAPFFEQYYLAYASKLVEASKSGSLNLLNQELIRWLASLLGITRRFVSSSSLDPRGKRGGHLVDICKILGATTYISPVGSVGYLREEHTVFEEAGLTLVFHNYDHPEYQQCYIPFIPYASTIDLLFNLGPKSLSVIRSGRRRPLTLEEVLV